MLPWGKRVRSFSPTKINFRGFFSVRTARQLSSHMRNSNALRDVMSQLRFYWSLCVRASSAVDDIVSHENRPKVACVRILYMFIFFFRVSFFSTVWTTTIDFGGESTTFAPSVLVKAWTIPARSNLCILIFHLLFRSIQRQQQPQNPIKKYKLIDRIL